MQDEPEASCYPKQYRIFPATKKKDGGIRYLKDRKANMKSLSVAKAGINWSKKWISIVLQLE